MALDGIGSGTPASGATAAPIDQRAALPQLAAEIATLRQSDPAQAATLQRQSEAAMTPVERGQLAAAIDAKVADGGWRGSFDRAMAAPRAAAAFQSGLREGLFEGAKSFVLDTATLVGKTVQFGADQMPGGWLGDKLRDATGGLPGVLDAVVPSNARGAATADSLGKTAGAIRDYAISRAQDPSKLLADTEGFIQKNWDSLKGSHAEAAARGPEAEAKWWGQTMGRVAFEIGSSFVPVAGQAGKVTQGARAVDRAGDAARVVETAGDAARAADAGTTANRTGDVAATARREIVMDGGEKGDWPKELNARDLEPNAVYRVNGYSYVTDAKGRVTSVEGSLDLKTADRNGYQQRVSGREDRLPDDQGGHLIASIFNGPGDRLNMVPMNGNFNMGAWRQLESKLADMVADGKKVDVKIDVRYGADSGRPDAFVATYVVDGGRPVREAFLNTPGGK